MYNRFYDSRVAEPDPGNLVGSDSGFRKGNFIFESGFLRAKNATVTQKKENTVLTI